MTTEGGGGSRLPSLGPRGEGWVAGQMLLIFGEGVVSYPAIVALPPDAATGWLLLAAGGMLVVLGSVLVYLGIDGLGRNLTALPAPPDGAPLVDWGVYGRIRHPIYAGVILLAVGWALGLASLPALVVAAALVVWLDLKSRREEVWLLERHPGYAAYRSGTSRFLPGIY